MTTGEMTTGEMTTDMGQAMAKAMERLGLIETVFLSTAGQGSTTGVNMLCSALGRENKFYGMILNTWGKARGGSTSHVLRIGDRPGLPKCGVINPNNVVMMSDSKLTVPDAMTEALLLKFRSGLLIVNTSRSPEEFQYPYTFDGDAIAINITEIADGMTEMRPAPPGLAMVSVYAGATHLVSLDSLSQSVEYYFTHHGLHPANAAKLVPANLKGVQAAYEAGQSAQRVHIHGLGERSKTYVRQSLEDKRPRRGSMATFPLPTYQSGQNPNIFRDRVPVWLNSKCVRCRYCASWLFCPEHCYSIIEGRIGQPFDVKVDHSYCKGCSVCEDVCHFGAIEMRLEE